MTPFLVYAPQVDGVRTTYAVSRCAIVHDGSGRDVKIGSEELRERQTAYGRGDLAAKDRIAASRAPFNGAPTQLFEVLATAAASELTAIDTQ